MDTSALGRMIMVLGVVLLVVGLLLTVGPRIPWPRLPGDFSFGGPNTRVYVPLGTCIALSLLINLILWLFHRK